MKRLESLNCKNSRP